MWMLAAPLVPQVCLPHISCSGLFWNSKTIKNKNFFTTTWLKSYSNLLFYLFYLNNQTSLRLHYGVEYYLSRVWFSRDLDEIDNDKNGKKLENVGTASTFLIRLTCYLTLLQRSFTKLRRWAVLSTSKPSQKQCRVVAGSSVYFLVRVMRLLMSNRIFENRQLDLCMYLLGLPLQILLKFRFKWVEGIILVLNADHFNKVITEMP